MGVGRIHREQVWHSQYLERNTSQTKVFLSFIIGAATIVPMTVVLQSIVAVVPLIVLIISALTTIINVFLIRAILNHTAAPFLIGMVIQTISYALMGAYGWGANQHIALPWISLVAHTHAIGCLVAIVLIWLPRHNASDGTDPMNIFEVFGLVLLGIAALAIRLYRITEIPVPGNLEAISALYSQAYLRQEFLNPAALNIDGTALLLALLQSASSSIFGADIGAMRMLSALYGSATIVMLYVSTRLFFDRRTAWLTALALMAMSVHLEFSRLAIPYVADGLLLCSILAALATGWESGKRRWYVLAGMLLGLCQYTYHSGKIIPVIYALWLAVLAIANWSMIEMRLRQLGVMWLVAAVVALPMWLTMFVQWPTYWGMLNQVSIFADNPLTGQGWLVQIATQQQQPIWLTALYQVRDAAAAFVIVPLRDGYDVGMPMLTIPSAILFSIGMLLMIREYDDPRYWILFIGLASAIGVAAITIDTPAAQRMVYIAPFVATVIGIGLAESGRWFRLEWIQTDWSINPLIIQGLSIVVAVAVAGYDGYTYIQNTGTQSASIEEQSASAMSSKLVNYPSGSQVYLFTAPQLVYGNSALLRLNAPSVSGIDVYPPLNANPTWVLNAPIHLFVFSPGRIGEMNLIRRAYPGGQESRTYQQNGELLLVFYEVNGVGNNSTP